MRSIAAFLLLFIFLAGGAGLGKSEDTSQPEPENQTEAGEEAKQAPKPKQEMPEPEKEEHLAGGFTEIDPSSDEALKAYEFLEKELAVKHPEVTLVVVTGAATQVVAGLNVRLTCTYKIEGSGEEYKCRARIYLNFELVPVKVLELYLEHAE